MKRVMESKDIDLKSLSGRNRRLFYEWQKLESLSSGRSDLTCRVLRQNAAGLPVAYVIDYRLWSICGVERVEHLGTPGLTNPPLFAKGYRMQIDLPPSYPCVDALPVFHFLTTGEDGCAVPHPWHPNIRWFGQFAGRVCINMTDTYANLAWGVDRVSQYLRYERYHAVAEPPYPEDLKVAAWVVRQGEPNEWIYFSQDDNEHN